MEPRTHDYTSRSWGHDYVISEVRGGGKVLVCFGWGPDAKTKMRSSDFVILPNKDDTTRYRITDISYYRDPPDMWRARLEFAPREQ